MTGSECYAPGEMFTRIKNCTPVSTTPGALDVVLYLATIFQCIPVDEKQKVTIKNGTLTASRTLYPDGKLYRVSIQDFKQDIIFLAVCKEDIWEIVRNTMQEKDLMLMEHTFDKVRSCMTSIDKFINEYPPIGIE